MSRCATDKSAGKWSAFRCKMHRDTGHAPVSAGNWRPGVVDGVGLGEDELADGHHGVAVVDETGEDGGQGLRRVQRGVVEQHDAALPHPAGHPLADGIRVVVLPVQGIPIGNDLKPLRRKGLLGWWRCASGKNLTCKRGVWGCFRRGRGQNRGGAR